MRMSANVTTPTSSLTVPTTASSSTRWACSPGTEPSGADEVSELQGNGLVYIG